MIGTYGAYADMIRYIGNLAAHPSSVNGKFDPIEIEYEDAFLCLEMLEELFYFFYERPLDFEMRMMGLEGRLVALRKSISDGVVQQNM